MHESLKKTIANTCLVAASLLPLRAALAQEAAPPGKRPQPPEAVDAFEHREVPKASVMAYARRQEPYVPSVFSDVRAALNASLKEMARHGGKPRALSASDIQAWREGKMASAISEREREDIASLARQAEAALAAAFEESKAGNTVRAVSLAATDVLAAPLVPFMLLEKAFVRAIETEQVREMWR